MTKTELSERETIKVLDIMRAAEDRCGKILSELANKPTDITSEGLIPNLDIDRYYDRLLRVVGRALFEVSRCFAKESDNIDTYFWPGYNSILGQDAPRRVQIIPEMFTNIPGGIGFESTSLTEDYIDYIDSIQHNISLVDATGYYDLSHTSLWFDCLLSPYNKDDVFSDGTRFIVGGTHHWVTSRNVKLNDNTPLDVLSIGISEEESPPPKKGFISVNLKPHEYNDWGRQIGEYLESTVPDGATWPSDPEWDTIKYELKKNRARNITRRLYSIWLKNNFDPTWKLHDISAMVDDTRRRGEWKGLDKLADRVKALAYATTGQLSKIIDREDSAIYYGIELLECASTLKPHEYKHWYTLALKKTILIPGLKEIPNEIGSAMLYSSVELPEVFFSLVKPWIESIYLEIRSFESALLLKQRAGLEGQQRQARIFAHQTAGLVTVPWADPERIHLEDESQFLLWMAVTLTTHIWGTVNLKPKSPIYDEAGFPEWENLKLQPEEILEKLISFAFLHGLQRASKAPRRPDPGAGNSWLQKLSEAKEAAILLQQRSERDALLRERLGFCLPSYPPKSWMVYKGFILCFHHSLWQATNHAFKASLEGGHETYLWIEWDDNSLTIFNRSALLNGESPKRPSDMDFLEFLKLRLLNVFSVDGPEQIKNEQTQAELNVWRTRIVYKEDSNGLK